MSTTALAMPEAPEIEKNANALLAEANRHQITDESSLAVSAGVRTIIKGLKKQIDDTFDASITSAHQTHKTMVAAKKRHTDPLDAADRIHKSKIEGFYFEQERKALAEQQAREAAARAEEEKRRKAEAAALRAEGDRKAAKPVMAAPLVVNVAPVAAPPKVAGVTMSKVWKHKIVDKKLIPLEFMEPDEVKIGKIVRAMGGETRIPGVEVFEQMQASNR